MNPNTAQSLDPKLKEVYDRVMGAPVPPPPSAKPALQHIPIEGIPVQNAPAPQPPPAQPSAATSPAAEPQMVSINTSAPAPATKSASSKKISPIIFVAAGVGFFLLYTVVWLKVFKIF